MYVCHSERFASMNFSTTCSPSAFLRRSSFSRQSSASERFPGRTSIFRRFFSRCRHLEDVLVHGLARVELVLDAVEARREHDGEREVRVARRVRHPHLATRPHAAPRRDAHHRRAVALGPRDVHGRFVAGHEPLVRVHERVRDGGDRARVLQDAADVVHREAGELVLRLRVEERVLHGRAGARDERLVRRACRSRSRRKSASA